MKVLGQRKIVLLGPTSLASQYASFPAIIKPPKNKHKQSQPLMEELPAKILKLSDFISGARHVAGVSSVTPENPAPDFDWKRYEKHPKTPRPNPSNAAAGKLLDPLKNPAVLVGTVSLPAHIENDDVVTSIQCCCFQFTDDSATICCDILNFHPRILGRKARVGAWNFIPLNYSGCRLGGFLEIISWELVESSLNSSSSFSLAVDFRTDSNEEDCKAKYCLFGVLECLSPVTVVSSLSSSRNISGFLARVSVCDCILCRSRKGAVELEELAAGNRKAHSFVKSLIVYFCGFASCWHPAIVKLIGGTVVLSGLKRKLVYIVKDVSELMYVTSERTLLHVPLMVKKGVSNSKLRLRGVGEVGSYVGIVTRVHMNGMVVELDQELLLLLTDRQLMVPHSLRIGALVCVRNVHIVNPRFGWTKTLVLGACFITCICVESFSPLEAGVYKRSCSHSLLWKFVDSLTFSARLWVLLTVMCFQKKFAGTLSGQEILGSKHMVGLAQTYATSCLPASAYRKQHGVLMEFCKHSSCSHVEEEDYSQMKLAVPISWFRIYLENRWMKEQLDLENDFNVFSKVVGRNYLSCCGRSYRKLIRKVFLSEETGVCLLGFMKVSLSSGRLQLVDASGSIDVIIPNFPLSWNFNRVYEVEDFKVIVQGISGELNNSEVYPCVPFSCRSIFGDPPVKRDTQLSVFLIHHLRDENSKLYPSSSSIHCKDIFQQSDVGNLHLLWLKHKFPMTTKSFGYQVIPNKSRAFAEAIILPWHLVLSQKDATEHLKGFHLEELGNVENLEKQVVLKRCKTDKSLSGGERNSCEIRSLKDLRFKFPCIVSCNSFECPRQGFICCTDKKAVASSRWKPDGSEILLEFDSESLYIYQGLRIGAYYIIKDQMNDFLFTAKNDNRTMLVTTETCLWSLSLSDAVYENSNSSSAFPFPSSLEVDSMHDASLLSEPCCSDITLHMLSDTLNYLKIGRNVSDSGISKSSVTFEQNTEISNGLLPEGALVSLHGRVLDVHYSDGASVISHSNLNNSSADACQSCIHVLANNNMVLILGSLGERTCPAGFGPGVDATFHRILVLGGQNQYMLLSASFIVIESATVSEYMDEWDTTLDCALLQLETLQNVVPVDLISEITRNLDLKPMKLHVRVVGIMLVVLQRNKKSGNSSTKAHSCAYIADIPLAGFLVEDGSFSCCCWADHQSAATILGLRAESTSREARTKIPERHDLNVILRHHNRVILRNHGSVTDASCLDWTVSVEDSSKPVSSYNQNFLRRVIMNACSSKLWTVTATHMDSRSMQRLENRVGELGMTALPLQHIWVSDVQPCDPLAESRRIIQGLVNS